MGKKRKRGGGVQEEMNKDRWMEEERKMEGKYKEGKTEKRKIGVEELMKERWKERENKIKRKKERKRDRRKEREWDRGRRTPLQYVQCTHWEAEGTGWMDEIPSFCLLGLSLNLPAHTSPFSEAEQRTMTGRVGGAAQ